MSSGASDSGEKRSNIRLLLPVTGVGGAGCGVGGGKSVSAELVLSLLSYHGTTPDNRQHFYAFGNCAAQELRQSGIDRNNWEQRLSPQSS